MYEMIQFATKAFVTICQLLAIFVISIGVIKGLIIFLKDAILGQKTTEAISESRLELGHAFSLGLGFLIGASIINTTIAPTWDDIGKLASIIMIRTILNYFLLHEISSITHSQPEQTGSDNKLLRMGMFSALAIAIHNFPEGLATFMGALTDPGLGISIAVAIAIHNIPEGVAVSAPIFYATKSRRKAFYLSFLSGLAEPVGALIGYFILRSIFNEVTFGVIFASVAGIMIYISLDELLPTAEEYGEHHIAIGGLVAGMFIMAVSLLLFV